MGAIQIIAEPTQPGGATLADLSPALPQRGNFEQQKKTSLRGGTTWQFPICRATLYSLEIASYLAMTRGEGSKPPAVARPILLKSGFTWFTLFMVNIYITN